MHACMYAHTCACECVCICRDMEEASGVAPAPATCWRPALLEQERTTLGSPGTVWAESTTTVCRRHWEPWGALGWAGYL